MPRRRPRERHAVGLGRVSSLSSNVSVSVMGMVMGTGSQHLQRLAATTSVALSASG